ncbi:carboxymuconolactone decarboxylase family protein [Kitasatospora xanthocidica]|uniref:Carboxymuconolactone decarboxylase family protein n=1 Tax=Kitasatospora xanthocidica TaxID=83382 RepID=A0A373A028_9ACTN|nr:carboxymuconolactone decarboxylase family protein [Kitasatospora xanthocidica]RGD60795.1 carboxymuconolactone decarboxylase family protein [Kitasatospora xanthocidica]
MTTNETTRATADGTAGTDGAPVPAPEQRLLMHKLAPAYYQAMVAVDRASREGVDPVIAELVKVHASMLNGCAFCIDMHSTDARKHGEQDHRLVSLPAWRETPWFTARERAALALTESVTLLTQGHVPDAVYAEAAARFDETELAQLIALIATINAWNRIGVSTRMSPAAR